MDAAEIEAFLSPIGVQLHCSVSTQRIALNALVYLYKRYMGLDIGDLSYSLASVPRRLPVVYSRDQVVAILAQLLGTYRLQVGLMCGTGLRSAELLSLRVKEIDFVIVIFLLGRQG
jgi:integrase